MNFAKNEEKIQKVELFLVPNATHSEDKSMMEAAHMRVHCRHPNSRCFLCLWDYATINDDDDEDDYG